MADTGKEIDAESLTQTFQIQNVPAVDVLLFEKIVAEFVCSEEEGDEFYYDDGNITAGAFSYAVKRIFQKLYSDEGYEESKRNSIAKLGVFGEDCFVNTENPSP